MKQIKILLFIYSLFIIFLCAAANDFANSLYAQLVFIAFSILLLPRKNTLFYTDKFILGFIGIYLLIELIHCVTAGFIYFGSIKYMTLLICVYYIIKRYSFQFTDILFNVMYYLTILSLPLFALQVVNPSLIKSAFGSLNFSFEALRNSGNVYVFIYNIIPDYDGVRNSGFMWEPCSFGGMILFTIIYLFVRNGFVLNRKIVLLTIAAITTLSTATFLGLMVIVLIIGFKKLHPVLLLAALPLIALLYIEVSRLPFMQDKIEFYFENNVDYLDVYSKSYFQNKQSIGRFGGLMIELDNLSKNPIVGMGWQEDYDSIGLRNNDWSNPNGMAVLLGKFGLAGIAFIITGLFYFFRNNVSLTLIELFGLIVIILIPMFSNPFQSNIVFWTFIFAGYNANHQNSNR